MDVRQGILRSLLICIVCGLFLSAVFGQATVIRGGWLFDGTGDARVRNPGIVIQAGKILAVGEAGGDGDISQVITVGDAQTILPGFIDLHAHYAVDFFGKGRVDETEVYPLLFLANGVTTTFPAGEIDPVKMRRLRIDIDDGRRIGPRLLNSGPYFGTARYGWDRNITPARIEAEVNHWAAQGVRGFKAKNITVPHLKALIQAAHRHGLTVTGHLNSGVGDSVNPSDAILMGIDRVEHFLGGDALSRSQHAYMSWKDVDVQSDAFKSIVRLYIEQRVYFDATIAAFGSFGAVESPVFADFADERRYLTPYLRGRTGPRPEDDFTQLAAAMYESKKRTVKAFYEAGGGDLITLGTDHPSWGVYLTPFYIHREMQVMVRSGLPESAVLRIATLNGARAMGLSQHLGSIEPGKWADMVVVNGNPLADITATRNVAWTMKAGVIYKTADLLSRSKDRLGPTRESEESDWQQPRR